VTTKPTNDHPVSSNNPCPFLRALVAQGSLHDATEPLSKVVSTVVAVARRGQGHPTLPAAVVYAIAMIANGLGPSSLLRSQTVGLRLNQLRGGPLDKRGVGSGILDARGEIQPDNLARLAEFATDKTGRDGVSEPGLDLSELVRFMDANFERARTRRRRIDRALMNGEWPVLLKVMGKDGMGGRYLSLAEVRALFVQRRLPARMASRAGART